MKKINASHPYVQAWHFILLLSAVLAFYMWPQAIIEHRLKSFFAVLIVLAVFFVHVVFVNKFDVYKAKEPLLSFEIPIPGWLKILWEILLFASATWIYAQNQSSLFLQFYVFAIVLLYLLSWDRSWLMLRGKEKGSSKREV